MLRGRNLLALALTAGAWLCVWNERVDAGLELVSQSIQLDSADHQVDFTLTFNHAPNFQSVDSFGRPADSFQYEIVPNTLQPFSQFPFPNSIAAVIRGDEIGSGKWLPIRSGVQNGSSSSPASGGWGAVRGDVPYTLSGNRLSFSASYSLLGTTNGQFSYDLFTTNYGATVSDVQGTSVSVPLPSALPIGIGMLGAIALVGTLRKLMSSKSH